MAERIIEVDYKEGEFTLRFKPRRFRPFSGATAGHLRTANKELLLAIRGCVDQAIEWLEPKERPRGGHRTRIEIKRREESTPEPEG